MEHTTTTNALLMTTAEHNSTGHDPIANSSFVTHDAVFIHQFSTGEVAFWFWLYGCIALLSVFGNALVIYVISTRTIMQNVPNYFILNLAVADFITGLIAVPFKFQAVLQQEWTLPHFMCQVLTFIETLSLSVSVFTLTGGAIDRFIIVVMAQGSKMSRRTALVIIGAIWAFSIVCSLPFGALHKVFVFHKDLIITNTSGIDPSELVWRCLPIYMTSKYWNWYNIYLTIIEYFVPLIIIDCAYILIARKVWGQRGNQGRGKRFQKDRKKVVKLLVLVVLMFTFCWFPYEVYLLLCEITPWINYYYYINVIFMCLHCLAMSNSSLNPIIYAIFNKKFRREYVRVWNRMRRKQAGLGSMLQSMRSREGLLMMTAAQQNGGGGQCANANNREPDAKCATADFIAGELGR